MIKRYILLSLLYIAICIGLGHTKHHIYPDLTFYSIALGQNKEQVRSVETLKPMDISIEDESLDMLVYQDTNRQIVIMYYFDRKTEKLYRKMINYYDYKHKDQYLTKATDVFNRQYGKATVLKNKTGTTLKWTDEKVQVEVVDSLFLEFVIELYSDTKYLDQ